MAQSMALNPAAGPLGGGMLKSGYKHLEGLDAATLRNIDACRQLSNVLSSSLGPQGMNKLVVNHLGKIIVTSDAAAVLRELDIEHPAAKMLAMAADAQDAECGDGTNLTVSFAGELLGEAEELLRTGLHVSDIVAGYKLAAQKMEEVLPTLVVDRLQISASKDPMHTLDQVTRMVRPVLMAKHLGSEDVLAPLVAKACLSTMSSASSSGKRVNVDSVRTTKILGGSVNMSQVIRGMVVPRPTENVTSGASSKTPLSVRNAKIAIFNCGLEASTTEAKGTVLMKNAEDLKTYNKSEEIKMQEAIESIVGAKDGKNNVQVVISGGTISEMALHFLEQHGVMCLKVGSKWDLRRLCAATGATALVRLGPPTPEELGYCDTVEVKEIGGKHVTIFANDDVDTSDEKSTKAADGCRVSTILLRASTSSLLADLERAVDDGIHAVDVACRGNHNLAGCLVPGAGASEMALSRAVRAYGDTMVGLEQYAVRAFASALEFVPKQLATNAGYDASEILAALSKEHAATTAAGNKDGKMVVPTWGVDIWGEDGSADGNHTKGIRDTKTELVDVLETKLSALRLAVDAAMTVLRVDQIIMAKPAGAGGAGR